MKHEPAPILMLPPAASVAMAANDDRERVLLDGRPATITAWWCEDRRAGVDLDLDDGGQRWCYWPSPRITSMPEEASMITLTEEQRQEALRLCEQLETTMQRLDADFAKLKEAADEWRAAWGELQQQEMSPK